MNLFSKNFNALKKIIIYQPPESPPPFVLDEAEKPGETISKQQLNLSTAQHDAYLRYARRVAITIEKAILYLKEPFQRENIDTLKAELTALNEQTEQLSPLITGYSATQKQVNQPISTSLEENRLALERLYNLPDNKDLIIRSITIPVTPPVSAYLAYIEGLVDKKIINLSVLQPLMLWEKDRQLPTGNLVTQLIKECLPTNQVRFASTLRDVVDRINLGSTAIFFDGEAEAVLVETIGQEHRSIDRPMIEQSVRGSQTAFSETLRVNTGLVRAVLRTSDLTTELLSIGARSNTSCALMYLKSVINPVLVQEIKRRLVSIKVDAIVESGTLQLLIQDHPMMPYPQMLTTERPDRVAAALTEGRLAILIDGSPFVIVAPISLFTLFHTAEDFSFSWMVASFSRLLRLLGTLLTIMLPALYIAISYFHQEALPTDLILAIGGARERVPFPAVLEIAAMEFAFELLRESGTRIPGMLGSTIGIVGAIILGQAGIAASVVSPITVVIIAITGLASFVIPDYSLAFAIRLTRFVFEVLAAMLGLVGLSGGILIITVMLCGMKSLGVPYLSPLGPKTAIGYDVIVRGPAYSQELRPDELSPQDLRRQASVSRQWIKEEPTGKEDQP